MAMCAPAAPVQGTPVESNAPNAAPVVVQATVVQAVPVGPPEGQPVAGQPVVGQPVIQGTPMTAPAMIGMTALSPEEQHAHQMRQQDDTGTILGWALYITGWFVCCCCGPFGPVFWLGIAAIHYCKPKEQRDQLPQERTVATVSMITGIFCTFVTIAVICLVLFMGDSSDDSSSSNNSNNSGNQNSFDN
eukprot:CAMPEP_0178413064 /NCGR_PEP_ID=MMETSP0689_2-20121128/22337_1 /TAXON_ID=160604 /ORGANISM="Amphidinium massartii, Strain CS-259" /LENGTH=188 /DNA_ID=CAMNT_0020034329 /DNA_START=48 /DNA_END=611 /DNA_ORIENTATION=-